MGRRKRVGDCSHRGLEAFIDAKIFQVRDTDATVQVPEDHYLFLEWTKVHGMDG